MFDPSTRSGIITPFGSLVEPLVYCRITSRSGSGGGISIASALPLPPPMTAAIGTSGGSPGAAS